MITNFDKQAIENANFLLKLKSDPGLCVYCVALGLKVEDLVYGRIEEKSIAEYEKRYAEQLKTDELNAEVFRLRKERQESRLRSFLYYWQFNPTDPVRDALDKWSKQNKKTKPYDKTYKYINSLREKYPNSAINTATVFEAFEADLLAAKEKFNEELKQKLIAPVVQENEVLNEQVKSKDQQIEGYKTQVASLETRVQTAEQRNVDLIAKHIEDKKVLEEKNHELAVENLDLKQKVDKLKEIHGEKYSFTPNKIGSIYEKKLPAKSATEQAKAVPSAEKPKGESMAGLIKTVPGTVLGDKSKAETVEKKPEARPTTDYTPVPSSQPKG